MSRTALHEPDVSLAPHLSKNTLCLATASTQSNFAAIQQLPFFADVEEEIILKLISLARWRVYAMDEIIVDSGDPTDDVFFIIEGAVRVVVRTSFGYESILADMGAGEFFGELAAIDGVQRSANVTALLHTRVCIVPAAAFLEFVLASPQAGRRLLRLLSTRLRAKDERLLEFGALSVRQRLIAELLRLSRDRGHGERVLSPPPAQHVLAARIGTRRESVSRELAEMSRTGLLTVGRRAIVLHQAEIMRMEVVERLQGKEDRLA